MSKGKARLPNPQGKFGFFAVNEGKQIINIEKKMKVKAIILSLLPSVEQ